MPDRHWTLVGVLTAGDPEDNSEFGRSVALSGNLAVVGAPFKDGVSPGGDPLPDAGAAYVFAVGPDRDQNGVMDVCDCRSAVGGGAPGVRGWVEVGTSSGRVGNPPHPAAPAGFVGNPPHSAATAGFVGNPDLNLDRVVDLADVMILLSNYGHSRDDPPGGQSPPYSALHEYGDLDLDQDIDLQDLALMLSASGGSCE
jgi:hypothetical protein